MGVLEFLRKKYFGEYELTDPKLCYSLVRDVKHPNRGTSLSAGLDFFVPNDITPITLKPGESALIPSGVHVKLDPEWVLIGFNKSGVAAKKSLLIGAQVIDADYEGEIHLNVHNVGFNNQTIVPGEKLTQFILLRVAIEQPMYFDNLKDLYNNQISERGTGMMGSTGTS